MTFYNLNLFSSVEPFEKYKQIAKSKYKYRPILYGTDSNKSKTFSNVKKCYDLYETNKEYLEQVVPYKGFTIEEKEALVHCYTGNTKLVREVREDIINNQNIHYRTKCGYCGLGDTNYLDHYLPKDDFPEYAIHIHNLVPCCSYCNEKKSNLFLDETGLRKVFNPYFEEVGEQPIINCTLECLDTTIRSHLTIRKDIDNQVWINHLSTLDIIKRYKSELPRVLCTIMFDLIANFEEANRDFKGSKRVLNRNLSEVEKIQGYNSLEAIVYRAYLEVDQLFDVEYIRKVYFNMARSLKSQNAS
ncbi:HNH endonuclease [Cytobacillus oceanisediminis]|uniref:HNH endonuclease n=1 Tax=Cytobacillus oceanisediminis TaxID=665099 RepID=UPI0037359BBB